MMLNYRRTFKDSLNSPPTEDTLSRDTFAVASLSLHAVSFIKTIQTNFRKNSDLRVFNDSK
jgi:hypothetical protein